MKQIFAKSEDKIEEFKPDTQKVIIRPTQKVIVHSKGDSCHSKGDN